MWQCAVHLYGVPPQPQAASRGWWREWIPIVSGVPQGSVLGPLLFILYTSETFELVKNRLYADADDSTLKPANRPAVADSLNSDLAKIQEWWITGAWCWILIKLRLLWLVDPGLWTLPRVTWSCLGFPFALVPTSIFLAWSLTAGSPSKTMCAVLSLVSLKELAFWGWWSVSLWTPLCCFVATMHLFSQSLSTYCSSVLGSATECHLQLLERQVYSVARLCPDQTFSSLCHRRHVAALCMLYKVNSNSNHCLFSELPSASVRVRHSKLRLQLTLEFEVSRCRTSQFARCFLAAQTHVRNDLPSLCLTPERQMRLREQ